MMNDIILPLAAGLAIFLFGMKLMETSLHRSAGQALTQLLERFTRTPVRGMAASAGLSAILQSSTAITVITVGLVNAGLIAFPQTLGVILGSNIGTCLTTELLGLNLSRLGLPLLYAAAAVCGLGALLSRRCPWARRMAWAAAAAAGFACILLGMAAMQSPVPAMQERGIFTWLVSQSQESLLWGILAGTAVSALIHSSAASITMTMALVEGGALSPELGIAIVLGANVGTCATALLSSVGGTRFGAYVAITHTLLNAGGALLFWPLISEVALLSEWWGGSPASQIAHAQTIFNVVCSLIALPLCYLPPVRKITVR